MVRLTLLLLFLGFGLGAEMRTLALYRYLLSCIFSPSTYFWTISYHVNGAIKWKHLLFRLMGDIIVTFTQHFMNGQRMCSLEGTNITLHKKYLFEQRSGDSDEAEASHLQVVVITVALVGGRLDVEVVPEVHPGEVPEVSTS